MKKVWITSLTRKQEPVQKMMALVKNYGLAVDGHFWEDDVGKMVWHAPLGQITAPETGLWIILGEKADFAVASVRLGLSLLAISVQARKDYLFPIMLVATDGNLELEALPTALSGADELSFSGASAGAKIAAKANMPAKKIPAQYRLDTHALPGIGLWLEVGPVGQLWDGVVFGVQGGQITAHGVGKAGEIPQKAILEYPVKDMQLAIGEKQYKAWAVKNKLAEGQSYYLRVQGEPDSLIFGSFPEGEELDLYVLSLK
jgi:hypothetical protein